MFSKKLFSISVFPFAEVLLPTWLNLFRLFLLEFTFTLYCGHRLTCYIAPLEDFQIPAFVLFPYSLLVLSHWSLAKVCLWCAIHIWFSSWTLKTHASLTLSSLSVICQEGKACLFKSIMFSSCCLVISVGILITTNRYIEIMLIWYFPNSCPVYNWEREKQYWDL